MPLWRKLHLKTIDSTDVNSMPDDFTRLTWVFLTITVDKEGRGVYNPNWIKSKVFPMRDDVTSAMIRAAMEWLVARGMVCVYTVKHQEYFYIKKFHDYQNTEKEGKSHLPPPPKRSKKVQTYSGPTPEQGEEKSNTELEREGEEERDVKGDTESEGELGASALPTQQSLLDVSKNTFLYNVKDSDPFIGNLLKLSPPCTPPNATHFVEWFMNTYLKSKASHEKVRPTKNQIVQLWKQAFSSNGANAKLDPGSYSGWEAHTHTV